jgi:hypothetical protein
MNDFLSETNSLPPVDVPYIVVPQQPERET